MAGLSWQAVVAGVGGQGALFVTRVLAQAAVARGSEVLMSEVHGMAQKGGSVLSHLRAGAFAGPLVSQGEADLLLSLDAGEAQRNLAFLRRGGRLVVNAAGPDCLPAAARAALAGPGVAAHWVDAVGLAGPAQTQAQNVGALGLRGPGRALPFAAPELLAVVLDLTPPAWREANQKLFAAGVAAATAQA